MAKSGRTLTFHGAFGSKAAAVARERKVGGFIRTYTIKGHSRYVVMTRPQNQANPRRKSPEVFPWWLVAGVGAAILMLRSPAPVMSEAP